MEGLKPFFESAGSKVYLLEGEPKFLDFHINQSTFKVSLPVMLEMYKLFNGIWYGGLWRMLDICCSGFCELPSGHCRTPECPKMTEYEKAAYDDYLSRMRGLHMEENRPPIANSGASDIPQ